MTARRWVRVCSLAELEPGRGVAALVEGRQVAIFLLPALDGEPASRLRAVDNFDPGAGANVLSRGLLGTVGDVHYVASPLHKHRYDLATGQCLDNTAPAVRVWPVRVWGATVEVLSVTGDVADADTATHCPFCALQCGVRVRTAPGRRPEVAGDAGFPVNEGRLCVKGSTAAGLLDSAQRLLTPMVRDGRGVLRAASWEAALGELASRLDAVRRGHGPDAVGVFGSGALVNETAYLLGKFARVALGTANVDYNGRYCMSSAAAAGNRAFGVDRGLPFPLADIVATDTLVLWGANPADTMPPFMARVDQMRARGGRLFVVDPRRSATAALADEHVQPVPGTDLAVALGLVRLADTEGLVDARYVADRTTGWEEAADRARPWTPERVAAVSGVGEDQLRRLLQAVAEVPASMVLTGRGPEQQSKGTDTVSAIINLMLCLGRVGRPHSGYGCLTGQANGQGGREHGQKADQLPGYRSLLDPGDRAHVAAVWGVDPEALPGPGRDATDMLASIGTPGGIRALVVAGSDLAVAAPDAGSVAGSLADLDCLAVLDAFPGRTAELAHFVLPVTQWAEQDGTITNLEGRVLRRRPATDPPAGVRSDIDVLCDLAGRLGAGRHFTFETAAEVFDELRAATAGGRADYSGVTYERLDSGEAIHWPCRGPDDPGAPRLFRDRFAHQDGRARFAPVVWRPSAEQPDDTYPLWFTTGRYREHYNSGNQTRRLEALLGRNPRPLLQVHPDLARSSGLSSGDQVVVQSRRGSARFRVEVTDAVRRDVVFAPFHWPGEGSANLVTNTAVDPTSRMPELKLCAVRLVCTEGESASV